MVLEYDGAPFFGFQRQKGQKTVQGELERVLSLLLKEEVHVTGGGRTDRGVHALGQVINFRTECSHAPETLARAVSAHLRPHIVVTRAERVDDAFHARFSARGRVYQYLIRNARIPSIFESRFLTPVREPLDLEAMARAAALFMGKRDFRAFSTGESARVNTVRTVRRIELARGGCAERANHVSGFFDRAEIITIEIEADAFLHGMVRMIAGTLIDVGRGKTALDDVKALLADSRAGSGGPLALARGLCLLRIDYAGTAGKVHHDGNFKEEFPGKP